MYFYVNILTNCLFGHILYILVINNGRFHYLSKKQNIQHPSHKHSNSTLKKCTHSDIINKKKAKYDTHVPSNQDSTHKKRFAMIVFFGRRRVEDARSVFFFREGKVSTHQFFGNPAPNQHFEFLGSQISNQKFVLQRQITYKDFFQKWKL